MKLLQGNTSWLSTSLLGALTLAYVFIVFLPQQRAISALRDKLREKELILEESQQLQPVIRQKETNLTELLARVTTWKAQAPSEVQAARLLGAITNQAELAGVTMVRFEPQPALANQTLKQIPIAMALEGTFPELFRFVQGIERMPATIWLEDLQLSRIREDSDRLSCELSLRIFTVANEISD